MTQGDALPTVPREILTERLLLRPAWESDAEAVIEAIEESRSELQAWMAWPPNMRISDDVRQLAARGKSNWEARSDFGISIFRRDDGRFLGGTGLHDPNWNIPSFEIGYWMRTSEVGQGYGREAVIALTQVAFGNLGARRVQICCDPENARSRRVAESVGYTLEGQLRNEDRSPDGELRDTLVYSLIDSDDAVKNLLIG